MSWIIMATSHKTWEHKTQQVLQKPRKKFKQLSWTGTIPRSCQVQGVNEGCAVPLTAWGWCSCYSYNSKPSDNTDLYLTVKDRKIFHFLPPELPVGNGVFRVSDFPALREAGSGERKVVGWTQKFKMLSSVHLWSGECLSISFKACSPKCSVPMCSCLHCHTAWRVPVWQAQSSQAPFQYQEASQGHRDSTSSGKSFQKHRKARAWELELSL